MQNDCGSVGQLSYRCYTFMSHAQKLCLMWINYVSFRFANHQMPVVSCDNSNKSRGLVEMPTCHMYSQESLLTAVSYSADALSRMSSLWSSFWCITCASREGGCMIAESRCRAAGSANRHADVALLRKS